MSILDKINCPSDVKKLNYEEIQLLTEEIRSFLVRNVMHTGGHLASNLGVVELTLALASCFDFPKDKLIFDVGHQCYVYKMLTGRKDRFDTLRRLGGISGFPRTSESEYDFFDVGHAGTSISAAVGMARARDLAGDDSHVIVLVGDGAIANGMCFEAMNDVGVRKTRLIIILNDNEMSINRNVGGLSLHLTKLRFNPRYIHTKSNVHGILGKLGKVGKTADKAIRYVKSKLKYAAIASPLFEELGFTYMGIIDGNNFSDVSDALKRAKEIDGPVVIHTFTKKGMGYTEAENNPSKFHGVSSETVRISKREMGYDDVFSAVITSLSKKNDRITAITAAMTSGCGLSEFSKSFPERFFDVGIAEEHAVTMAAGMARGGYVPVVCMYSTFLQRTYDQIIHDVCLGGLHVVFCIGHAGLTGEDGETHQGLMDLSMLCHIPNMTILMPSCYEEMKSMITYAIDECTGPVAIRYPKAPISFRSPKELSPLGIEELTDGDDILILASGRMTDTAMEASSLLSQYGIGAQVIAIRSLKPLDTDALKDRIMGKKLVVTIEDNITHVGMGQYISAKTDICVPCLHLGFQSCFIPHGKQEELFEICKLDSRSVSERILSFYKGMGM